jgi:hypothetical protein
MGHSFSKKTVIVQSNYPICAFGNRWIMGNEEYSARLFTGFG